MCKASYNDAKLQNYQPGIFAPRILLLRLGGVLWTRPWEGSGRIGLLDVFTVFFQGFVRYFYVLSGLRISELIIWFIRLYMSKSEGHSLWCSQVLRDTPHPNVNVLVNKIRKHINGFLCWILRNKWCWLCGYQASHFSWLSLELADACLAFCPSGDKSWTDWFWVWLCIGTLLSGTLNPRSRHTTRKLPQIVSVCFTNRKCLDAGWRRTWHHPTHIWHISISKKWLEDCEAFQNQNCWHSTAHSTTLPRPATVHGEHLSW